MGLMSAGKNKTTCSYVWNIPFGTPNFDSISWQNGLITITTIKIVERDRIDTANTQIHDRSLSWLGTGMSIKTGRVKLALWV
jgi:hypothetical protein